jgi:hypothetical protein
MEMEYFSSTDNENDETRQQLACPYCKKIFARVDELNLHVLTRHTGSHAVRKLPKRRDDDETKAPTSP